MRDILYELRRTAGPFAFADPEEIVRADVELARLRQSRRILQEVERQRRLAIMRSRLRPTAIITPTAANPTGPNVGGPRLQEAPPFMATPSPFSYERIGRTSGLSPELIQRYAKYWGREGSVGGLVPRTLPDSGEPSPVYRDSFGHPFPVRPDGPAGWGQRPRSPVGIQVAGRGRAIRDILKTLFGAAAGGAIESQRQRIGREAPTQGGRMEATPPVPSSPPPVEPPDEELTNPKPEGRPFDPPWIEWGTTLPIPEPDKPQILIFPDIADEIDRLSILERREKEETRIQTDAVRDYFIDHLGAKHLRGGRRRKDGKEESELYIKGPGSAFLDERGRPGDGRPGAVSPDLTMKMPDGQIIHIQVADVDKTGWITDRELGNARRIRQATNQTVIIIPKEWQLARIRRRRGRR